MFIFLIILLVLVYLKLILVAAMKPKRSTLSHFELRHRTKRGDSEAEANMRRESFIADVLSLLRIATALLIVIFVLLNVVAFGWAIGIIVGVVGVLEYGALGRSKYMQALASRLYSFYEPYLIKFVVRFPSVLRLIGFIQPSDFDSVLQLGSRAELQQLVDSSEGVLSSVEKKMIVHSLSFSEVLVGSVMTPSSVVDTINKSEFLGPLTLDKLHKTGHSRLPVIDGDINHIIGILHLQSLLALDVKRSVTAEKAMEPRVFYIREDQTLQHALAAFLRMHHHLFIVVNEYRETVGLLTLEDVIEALLGRKIIDEFDSHEDLRTVALRNPHNNNTSPDHQDV